MTEPCFLSAAEAAAAIRAGTLTSEALVASCLRRIAVREDAVHAWAFLDPELALAQARAVVGETERQAWIAVTVATLGEVAKLRGDVPRARALFEQARGHYAAGDSDTGVAAMQERVQSLDKDRQSGRKVAASRTARTTTKKRRQS